MHFMSDSNVPIFQSFGTGPLCINAIGDGNPLPKTQPMKFLPVPSIWANF